MVMNEKERLKLEEFLVMMQDYKGTHTELVTVYIPAGYSHNNVSNQLEAEKGTAKNIKSTSTRKNVIDALESIIRYLKGMKQTPPNGLALFCGNVSKNEGQTDIQIWDLEPPMPLNVRMYRCDKEFVLTPLKEMVEIGEVFGLLVMDRKDAMIGLLEGKRIKVLESLTSGVPSKVRAGGQSSQRFHRVTEGLVKEFYKRIAEYMKTLFYDMPKLKGILVGGPIPTKDEFLEGQYLPTKLQEKVIGVQDIGYADEHGLKLLVEASQEVLSEQEIIKEKKLLERFFNTLGSNPKMAAYSAERVKKAFEYGAVDVLILSKNLDDATKSEFTTLALDTGATVEIVSIETNEGEQFFNLSGIGGLLRFSI